MDKMDNIKEADKLPIDSPKGVEFEATTAVAATPAAVAGGVAAGAALAGSAAAGAAVGDAVD